MELNPFSYEFHENPYPVYAWLREHAPLYYNEQLDFYALSRFKDVLAATQDWSIYSSAQGITLERLDTRMFDVTPMMIMMDPPRHDRLRKLVSQAFTPRRVAGLEPFVRSLANRLLEPLAERGGGDFVKDFSTPLPMEVIFTLLGVPEADRNQLRHWMDTSLERDRDTGKLPSSAIEASMSLLRYWFQLVRDLRQHRGDGLISNLIEVELEGEEGSAKKLTDGEISGFCALLGAAGNETTTKLLAHAIVLFARHPDQYAAIVDDGGLLPNAVEEALRYSSPAQYQGRTLTRDAEWYGQKVPKDARILLLTGSGNRDERQFSHPERFDIRRDVSMHLGFGYGVHFCLGASLARLETRVGLEEFTRRFPRYAIDEQRCTRVHMSNVHGFESVPFAAAA